MEFKYNRDPDKTWKLLKDINHQTVMILHALKEQEPECDPNNNLEFILGLMDLVRQEGPVLQGIITYLADCYGVDQEEMNRRLETWSKKRQLDCSAIWCLDATAIARFDTLTEALKAWEALEEDTAMNVGKNKFWVNKHHITIMPEDEFNNL